MTLNKVVKMASLSISDCQQAKQHYASCVLMLRLEFFIVMLSVVMLSVIMLRVVMLSVVAPHLKPDS